MEDISYLLNSYDIPNIYNHDEIEKLKEVSEQECQNLGMDNSKANLMLSWTKILEKYLHVVVSLSPVHPDYRNQLRNFPSVINCTNIDYIFEWKVEALSAVADKTLSKLDLSEYRKSILESLAQIHYSVSSLVDAFKIESKITAYVSPYTFITFLKTYESLLSEK